MDTITLWASRQLAGFAFDVALKNVAEFLGDVSKGTSEKIISDWFKETLKAGLHSRHKDEFSLAICKATALFLYLVQQELEGSGLRDDDLDRYERALNIFLREQVVQRWLAKAFEPGCQALDGQILEQAWRELGLPPLAEDFRWGKIGRVYLKRVEGLLGESQALKELFSAKQLSGIKESTKQVAGVVPDFDLERYGRSLRDAYEKLRWNQIDSTYSNYTVRLWSIFEPQNARESPRYAGAESPKEEDLLRQLGSGESNPSIVHLLREPECPLAVILGDPGAGKSSLLRFLALDWAEQPTAQIPLLIELREYVADENRPNDVLDFFHQGKRKICELNRLQLDQQLETGPALVMFDGLDEIIDADKRDAAITEIIAFKNKYPRVRLIVTSRIVGYDPERLQNAGFRHFTLVDFNQAQIASFIRKWHALALMEEQERERMEISKRLSTAIQSSQAIRLLAGNPLLLTMMAILNRKQELPRRRASLYEESAKVLLHAWDIEYKKMALTLDEADLTAKQELLRSVAYNMQTKPRREGKPGGASKDIIRIHREELQDEIVAFMTRRNAANPHRIAALLIEQLRKRDFMLCHVGNDYYAFVHRTFLEYFCASAIVMRFNKRGTEGGLELDQLKQDVFREHWRDQSWHEVMRLVIGHDLVDPAFAEDILLDLINQKTEDGNVAALILAADCYMEIEQKHKVEKLATELFRHLREALIKGNEPKTITKKLLTLWPADANLRAWLEEQAADHPMIAVREAIVKGIAELELPAIQTNSIETLGSLFYYQRRLEDVIVYFRNHQPKSFISRTRLLWAHSELKQHQVAITLGQQWLTLEPKSVFATIELGRAFQAAGRFGEAITALDQATELASKILNLASLCFSDKVLTYRDMGLYTLAVASSEKSIAIEPGSAYAHNQLGCVYHDLGLDEVAETSYLKAIALDASYSIPHNNLGFLLREREHWQEAIACFERALDINPRYSIALRNLALLHLLLGDPGRAEQAIQTAIQMDPYYANVKLLLGVFQALGGELSAARATWLAGLTLYPEHPLHHRVERTLYTVALGQPEQGLADLQRILQHERPPSGWLRSVLVMARLLERVPDPLPGLAEAVSLLERARENAPLFELKPPATA